MGRRVYTVKLLSGESVLMGVDYDSKIQPASNPQPEAKRSRGDTHRVLIPQPMSAQPTDAWVCPRPSLLGGERIQVTAHVSENNEIVERWQFSDSDVRWYRIENDAGDPVIPTVEQAKLE